MAIKINGQDLQKRIINGKEVEKVMLNRSQIRPEGNPPTFGEFKYDFRNGSIAGLQAAGFTDVELDFVYGYIYQVIDSNGVGVSNDYSPSDTAQDVRLNVYKSNLNLSQANIITVSMIGNFVQSANEGPKSISLWNKTWISGYQLYNYPPCIKGEVSYNSTSPNSGVYYLYQQPASPSDLIQYTASSGVSSETMIINLNTGIVRFMSTAVSTRPLGFSIQLSQDQIDKVRAMTSVCYTIYNYNNDYNVGSQDRIREILLKVE